MAIPVVVGLDGSEVGFAAVDWAAGEALRHGLPLRLVHVTTGERDASALIDAATERVRRCVPTVPLTSEVLHADPATALIGQGHDAFALVLGSRGLGDLDAMLLGSVGLAVAARAECPVVVVRGAAEHRESRFGSVVVGVENGEGSGTAVPFAFREAQVRHCGLVVVHAWTAPIDAHATARAPSWALEAHRRPPAQVLDDALRGLTERYGDVRVTRRVVEGPARRELLGAASAADLLIVGAPRRHGHPGLQLGLIGHAMLHHAPCPVAVVPRT
ncbi:universal stress protein [Streptomyces sp. NPDC059168]|uniref:universal stress protein n=1 Tax=Streptomyces sp. NPDC059168 TaxID=3346753 RepID=UPI0036818807